MMVHLAASCIIIIIIMHHHASSRIITHHSSLLTPSSCWRPNPLLRRPPSHRSRTPLWHTGIIRLRAAALGIGARVCCLSVCVCCLRALRVRGGLKQKQPA